MSPELMRKRSMIDECFVAHIDDRFHPVIRS